MLLQSFFEFHKDCFGLNFSTLKKETNNNVFFMSYILQSSSKSNVAKSSIDSLRNSFS